MNMQDFATVQTSLGQTSLGRTSLGQTSPGRSSREMFYGQSAHDHIEWRIKRRLSWYGMSALRIGLLERDERGTVFAKICDSDGTVVLRAVINPCTGHVRLTLLSATKTVRPSLDKP